MKTQYLLQLADKTRYQVTDWTLIGLSIGYYIEFILKEPRVEVFQARCKKTKKLLNYKKDPMWEMMNE